MEKQSVTIMKPTRLDYLNHDCTHADYYSAIAATAGYHYAGNPATDEQVRRALEAGDPFLNSIPLSAWDATARHLPPSNLGKAFRAHGDYPTLSGLVCLLKQAARDAVGWPDRLTPRERARGQKSYTASPE